MTDYAWEETQTDNLIDAQIEAARRTALAQAMTYTITPDGIRYDLPEIPLSEAIATCERILAEHEATFEPTDDQRERIKARIMEQCECAASGLKPCGMCEG